MAQPLQITSPNQKISVLLEKQVTDDLWRLSLHYHNNSEEVAVIPQINLGLTRNDQDFSTALSFVKASQPKPVRDQYTAIHGKRSLCRNEANEVVFTFRNPANSTMNLIVRAYNDGLAFRYEFPDKGGVFTIINEHTAYIVPDSTDRWLQKFDLSNEGLYSQMNNAAAQQNWCYPALFKVHNEECWYLIHEADVSRAYCATKLSNHDKAAAYKVTLPAPYEGEGEALPSISLPWKSPWRVIIAGQLADIVESTLVDDVSTPSVITDAEWIKPGKVSWNYWSDNHGTRNFQTLCEFTDLAAAMDWPYTLFDWEWDAMTNGGNVEDAAKYALSKGVQPLIWYNSGMFKWITATPVDRMLTHENRMKEFAWLKSHGFAGVKIDFFLSEKQYMIDYYLDILDDAAQFELLVYYHGCLVPRGWARTYPHLMTYEGVRGAEWYNNNAELTTTAPAHNTVLPFTRNVVGSMDYTPVTFTNSQHPHITSYGHELALSVLFESALQHLADRPDGYNNLPDAVRSFLKEVPTAWDDTKYLDGFPGRDVMIARQKGDVWYLGGINAENKEKTKSVNFGFLKAGEQYKLTLMADGRHDKTFETQYLVVDSNSKLDVKLLRRGGFAAVLKPVKF
ncbi:MAG: glycoside hydrolase family 97 catalytic domain-containing protein [Prolixibacteraceae bacterium]|nr:glycoside hydrolase family 97 catalytic domain-containing protein [Prolixibacteraceae bacterium]